MGIMLTIFSESDCWSEHGHFACDLANIIKQAQQHVPKWLDEGVPKYVTLMENQHGFVSRLLFWPLMKLCKWRLTCLLHFFQNCVISQPISYMKSAFDLSIKMLKVLIGFFLTLVIGYFFIFDNETQELTQRIGLDLLNTTISKYCQQKQTLN